MSNDLERFLQQAAERLAQKASGRPAPPVRPASSGSSSLPSNQARLRSAEPPRAEVVDAEVVNESRFSSLREAGPDPLSTIDTRPGLAQSIGQTDERMLDHVHQTFDHELTNLKAASSSLSQNQPVSNAVSDRDKSVPLIAMLRDPNSLRAAFIASEIFKRK